MLIFFNQSHVIHDVAIGMFYFIPLAFIVLILTLCAMSIQCAQPLSRGWILIFALLSLASYVASIGTFVAFAKKAST